MSLKLILSMTILLALNSAQALITSDRMSTQILKVYDKNVLVLNRGLEDGIFKGDHIKLTSTDGFIARGICLKAGMQLSHWKIYRVVRPQLVSKDTIYYLHSMNQSEIPKSLEGFREVDFSSYYNDYSDKDVNKALELQQERIAKYDLPSTMGETPKENLPKSKESDENEQFIERNFDSKKLTEDFSTFHLSVFGSPVSWQSRNSQRDLYFGFMAANDGEKYDFEIQGEQRETKTVDLYSGESVEKLWRRVDSTFTIKEISTNWSYFIYGLYESERQGDISNPKSQTNFGPVGFYRHFKKRNDKGEEFKFGFVPMIDSREYETIDNQTKDRFGMRLGLRLFYVENFSDKTSFKADFWHNPYVNLEDQDIDFDNNRTNLKALLSHKLNDHMAVEYQVQYFKDILFKRDLGVNPENIVNTINFRLGVGL